MGKESSHTIQHDGLKNLSLSDIIGKSINMKNKKIILWIALTVTAIVSVYAQQYDSESNFKVDWDDNGGVKIIKYTGSKKEVNIPPSIQNNQVTGIGKSAFQGNKNITRVTIPNSVTSIGNNAFFGSGLTRVTIPNGVTSIENNTFSNCTSFTGITIGDSVTSIGEQAFSGCTNLVSIAIPDNVTSIGNGAFSGCTKLAGVTIGSGVTKIGYGAFQNCTNLTSIIIPDSVISIGDSAYDGAFQSCTSLINITIGNSVTSIVNSTFFGCTSITSIIIPDNVSSIEDKAFYHCTRLASVTIGSGVTKIGETAFSGCTNLTSVTFQGKIPESCLLPFPGDLAGKYLASDGGPGTYTRFVDGETWRKQAGLAENVSQQESTTQSTTQPTPAPQPTITQQPVAQPKTTAPDGFVLINGGTFIMGSPDDGSQRQVKVGNFYMSKYEVTQKEYQEVMGKNPSKFKGDNLPVENVSWSNAIEYCNKRSQKEGLTPAYTKTSGNVTWDQNANGYRLPMEAEWEYACRAGTTTAYNTGADISDNTGWYSMNSGKKTHPVKQKPANAWGLYDMHGNVSEWCWNIYKGQDNVRVIRGGSWKDSARDLRSTFHSYGNSTSYWSNDLGFRVVRPM
jgi:formylglycine-generating enzyme required for sulfatase activity